jgi:hypothetical protein
MYRPLSRLIVSKGDSMSRRHVRGITLILTVAAWTAMGPVRPASAWTPNGEATTIVELWAWEGGGFHMIKTASGHYCRIATSTPTQRELLAMALSAHLLGTTVGVTCYDELKTAPGQPSYHDVHRLILIAQ